jgi:hypothetical protein
MPRDVTLETIIGFGITLNSILCSK